MFVLRGMLESHAAARAARRLSPEQIDELRALNIAIDAAIALDRPDVSTFLECNHNFHAIILDAAASPRLTATLGALVEQPVVRRTASRYGHEQLHRSAAEHAQLVASFEASDVEWARAVMLGHIRRAFHAFSDTFTKLEMARPAP